MVEQAREITRRQRGPQFIRRTINHFPIPAARERTLREFQEIGGNASFESAKIIFLGETHTRYHESLIGEFIRTHARKGDIVLVEGVEANNKVEGDSSKQATYHFPEKVHALGWDNTSLARLAWSCMPLLWEIYDGAKAALDAKDLEKAEEGLALFKELHREIDDVVIRQRNLSLISTLDDIRSTSSKKKIFIIAGSGHFTDDQNLKKRLGQDEFIVLRPKQQLEQSKKIEMARERYSRIPN